MPSVITSVDTFTKTHGEESKDLKGGGMNQSPVPNIVTSPH